MTPANFKKRLCEHGFVFMRGKFENRFTRETNGVQQHVARDSVRGMAWRIFMAVGTAPEIWPTVDVKAKIEDSFAEAESPRFAYFTDLDPTDPLDAQCDNREVALANCFEWLTTHGFLWLGNPNAKSIDEWRVVHGIRVKPKY
jgi:hypothetical protein